jgi:hypothetical protein
VAVAALIWITRAHSLTRRLYRIPDVATREEVQLVKTQVLQSIAAQKRSVKEAQIRG